MDRNANFMATHVTEVGFRVRSIHVVDDVEEEAVAAFREAIAKKPHFVLVTGGMGPGHDDNTRECVAKAVDLPLVLDEKGQEFLQNAYRRLVAHGVVRDAELNEQRLTMAMVPEGAICFENPIGTAPGVQLNVGSTMFFLLPGQPEELRRMFQSYVQPVLEAQGPDGYRVVSHIDYPGGDESAISRLLSDVARRHPGVHPRARLQGSTGEQEVRMKISLAAEGSDKDEVQKLLAEAEADLRARLGLEVGGLTAGE